jgi:hypothetical protein
MNAKTLGRLLILAALAAPVRAGAATPWTVFDLSGWKVTLPVNASGVESETADAVDVYPINDAGMAAVPNAAKYFYSSDGRSMTFYAPVEGATSARSHYPRSELRESAYRASHGNRDWPLSVGGELDATLAVDHVPSRKGRADDYQAIIGQIHGVDGELCKLVYSSSGKAIGGKRYNVYFVWDNSRVATKNFGVVPMSSKIPLGRSFSYKILVRNERLTVSVRANGSTYTVDPGALDPSWRDETYYFKAGVYDSANGAGQGGRARGTGAGQTTFTRLAIAH